MSPQYVLPFRRVLPLVVVVAGLGHCTAESGSLVHTLALNVQPLDGQPMPLEVPQDTGHKALKRVMTPDEIHKATPKDASRAQQMDPLGGWKTKQPVEVEDQDAAQGFHRIPGLTIDSPAIARVSGASLADCIKACKQVHLCTGVQFSQDAKLKGGNCLIMERRVQFSETFDYYERPGISAAQVREMDQEMQERWSTKDEERDQQNDLGGLSTWDIPGAHKIDFHKVREERAKFQSLQKTRTAIANINHRNMVFKQKKVERLRAQLREQAAEYKSTGKQAAALEVQEEAAERKASKLSAQATEQSVRRAKLKLEMVKLAKKSRKSIRVLEQAESKTKEYMQAYKAFQEAGNPLAGKMRKKFENWQKTLAAHKLDLLNTREQRLKLKVEASTAADEAKRLNKDADWAKIEHKDLAHQSGAAQELHKMAFEAQKALKKKLKDALGASSATTNWDPEN